MTARRASAERPGAQASPVGLWLARSRGMGSPLHPLRKLTERLSQEHEDFARRCAELRFLLEAGDWAGCDARWDTLRASLEGHLAHEEAWLLPVYELSGAHEASVGQALRAEHGQLRHEGARLRVALLRRTASVADIQALLEHLDAHARREESSLYRWLGQHADSASRAVTSGARDRRRASSA